MGFGLSSTACLISATVGFSKVVSTFAGMSWLTMTNIKGFKNYKNSNYCLLIILAPFSGYSHLKVSHLLHLFGPNIRFNYHIDTFCKNINPFSKIGDNKMNCFWHENPWHISFEIWKCKMILHAWWSSSLSLLSERHPSSLISCSSFKDKCSKDTQAYCLESCSSRGKFDQLIQVELKKFVTISISFISLISAFCFWKWCLTCR